MKGFDAAQDCSAIAARARASDMGFVGRYYSYNDAKNLSPFEARVLREAGLFIVSVWEARGDRYESFNADQGARDAAAALRLAEACGQPESSAIYFAVDFDVVPAQLDYGVRSYFGSVVSTISGRYRIGCYGSGLACMSLRDLAPLSWLSGATAWRGSRAFSAWAIKQRATTHAFGIDVDLDDAIDGDFGQWMSAGAPAAAESPVDLIKRAQRALGVADDGDPGPVTREAVRRWLAAHHPV